MGGAGGGGGGLYALARFWFSVIISRMKNVLFRRGISAVCAGILCASSASAWGKSAKEVFAEVARSVVVVLALDSSGETSAQGSGVVVGKNQIATNCHVIEDAAKIVVRQAADSSGDENYRMSAEILTRDDERDLCLLFVDELSEPPAAPVVTMGEAKGLTVGEEVFAIGAPNGLELSMSRGIVSQLRGVHGKHVAPLVQTDAAISPGSSGGGLFNENSELVGITTFKWKGENLNFAIPVEWVEGILLYRALFFNLSEKAILLLNNGADVNAKGYDSETPLHAAASNHASEIAALLLKNGAEVNAKDNDGETPLHEAAWSHASEVAALLLKNDAEVNVKDNDGETPLHEAAWSHASEVAALLLKNGAEVNKTNNNGWTPMDLAIFKNDSKMQSILRRHGGICVMKC